MPDKPRTGPFCPCGQPLDTYEELRASDDPMSRYIADAYLDPNSAYCADEDDVVTRDWWRDAEGHTYVR